MNSLPVTIMTNIMYHVIQSGNAGRVDYCNVLLYVCAHVMLWLQMVMNAA